MSEAVLVTGAGGYLGGAIVAALARKADPAIAVYRRKPAETIAPNVRTEICSLEDRTSVCALVERCRPANIVHAAAWIPSTTPSHRDIARAIDDNIVATLNLVRAAADAGTGRFILCSSVEVYPAAPLNGIAHRESDPTGPANAYGRSKCAAELSAQLLEGSSTSPVILRMPGIHGAPRRHGLVHNLITNARADRPIELSEPASILSLLMLDDAVAAITALLHSTATVQAGVVNLASGNMSLRNLAEIVVRQAGSRSRIGHGKGPARNRALDCSLAARLTLWPPTNLENAIAREISRHGTQTA